jgi:crotonobetainyl-CoA:carnitine CoA-transferase CaiB-like acyl-CoA transferase
MTPGSWGPPWTEQSSAYFEAVNRGKLSVDAGT